MLKLKINSGAGFDHLRRFFAHLSTGGDWAISLPAETRHNLKWFFSDSLFSSAGDGIAATYLSIYILALGATGAQIGLLSSLSGLMAAVVMIPGAWLVERVGRRKDITVWSGGGLARLCLLLLALLPLGVTGNTLIYLAIGLSICRDSFSNLAYPAWMSLVGDIVPLEGRGRYFGSRNFVMGVAGMATTIVAGELITRIGSPAGYQVALGVAFSVGMISTYSFFRIRDPHPQPIRKEQVTPGEKVSLPAMLHEMFRQPGFLALSFTAVLWNFSLNLAGPFFNVFMVRELHVTPTLIGINSVVTTIAGMLAQLAAGRYADRIGSRRLQLFSGLFIPILPLYWVFINADWQIIPINILGGALWGVYSLASFNLLLEMTPVEQRARYSALFQVVVTVALSIGAATGGGMVTLWGYRSVFLGSAIGRFSSALLFAWLVKPQKKG